jgi:hypothetical protein
VTITLFSAVLHIYHIHGICKSATISTNDCTARASAIGDSGNKTTRCDLAYRNVVRIALDPHSISVRTFADVTQLSIDKRFSILTHLFLREGP